jgi:hypothetical protein
MQSFFPLAVHAISLPKFVCHHFWPRLIAGAEFCGLILIFCWGASQVQTFFFFAISYFDGQKKVETMEAPPK